VKWLNNTGSVFEKMLCNYNAARKKIVCRGGYTVFVSVDEQVLFDFGIIHVGRPHRSRPCWCSSPTKARSVFEKISDEFF
jgi:hypothetical protein